MIAPKISDSLEAKHFLKRHGLTENTCISPLTCDCKEQVGNAKNISLIDVIHPSFWESFDAKTIVKSFSEDLKPLIIKYVLQKSEINLGLELYVLWFHQGHSGTMKVQLLFSSLLWYFCPREFHIIALYVQCFCLQETRRNPVEKPLLLMARGA